MDNSEVRWTAPQELIDDVDILSPRFQLEMGAYLQLVGVLVAALLVVRRARHVNAWRKRSASSILSAVHVDAVSNES